MNYDRINDHLDKKLIDFNLQAVGFLGAVLYKPLATATDPLFRKNMGERYFTGFSALLGGVVWLAAVFLAKLGSPFLQVVALRFNWQALFEFAEWSDRVHLTSWIGWTVLVAFAFLALGNLNASKKRQISGERWHSMSRGESIWGPENDARDIRIAGAIAVLLLILSLPVGLLFCISRALSYLLIAQEQASIYARFLDARDTEIENDHFQLTLEKGPAPRETEGLYKPLPKRFKGPQRTYVARVVAGGGGNVARQSDREQRPAIANPPQPMVSSGSVPARIANDQPAHSSPKATSPAAARVATSAASAGRSVNRARKGIPQKQTTSTPTQDQQTRGPEFSPEFMRMLRTCFGDNYIAALVEMKATRPNFPSEEELHRKLHHYRMPEALEEAEKANDVRGAIEYLLSRPS